MRSGETLNSNDHLEDAGLPCAPVDDDPSALLRRGDARFGARSFPGVVLGELVAIAGNGETPLVLFAGQAGTGAVPARATVDLHSAHIGRHVTLVFENADPTLPIVTGILGRPADPASDSIGQVELDSDGLRMVVQARSQLVLRCGKASITLTRTGKVIIDGSYVLSRSTGVNRIRGGAVQIN